MSEVREQTLVERHEFSNSSAIAEQLKDLCFKSKNLYNISLYQCRQNFFQNRYGLNYVTVYKNVMNNETYKKDYQSLPAKVSQQTLKSVATIFHSFTQALKEFYRNPEKFKAKPKLPHYKDKTNGKFIVTYTKQAISFKHLKEGYITLSGTDIKIETKVQNIQQVRIIPKAGYYVIEVVYKKEVEDKMLDKSNVIGIDLGINNLAAITSNKIGFQPILINGKTVKSINQYYNKKKSYLQSFLPVKVHSSNNINKLSIRRKRKIRHYFHNVSKYVVNLCIKNNIGTIVIGKNVGWKQDVNIGKINNQKFCFVPFNVLIEQITYKASMIGINVITNEESYTSKCSFLDKETIGKHDEYMGKRIKRGLFISKTGVKINSDVNGSYNIMRKVFPEKFEGIEGFVVIPKLQSFVA
jgi:putative transposase